MTSDKRAKFKAGEGNRTLVFSLEGCGSTIELHPQLESITLLPHSFETSLRPTPFTRSPLKMGGVGFEPTKA